MIRRIHFSAVDPGPDDDADLLRQAAQYLTDHPDRRLFDLKLDIDTNGGQQRSTLTLMVVSSLNAANP